MPVTVIMRGNCKFYTHPRQSTPIKSGFQHCAVNVTQPPSQEQLSMLRLGKEGFCFLCPHKPDCLVPVSLSLRERAHTSTLSLSTFM